MALTLLLGGARSGKSALAVRTAAGWKDGVTFVATASAGDEEMSERIERHQAERPPAWSCIEEPLDLAGALGRCGNGGAIVDCLTIWVANLLADRPAAAVVFEAERVAVLAANRAGPTIAVSNEVGLGVHPTTQLGREFRDVLGRVNAIWAEAAQEALFLVAGRALDLRPLDSFQGIDRG